MTKLVIASNNAGKLREFGQLLTPFDIEIVAQSELGVTETAEPYCTFIENALAKARHASRHTGMPALADDSGICVASLHGAPGVHSARYAGEPRSDRRNNEKLLAALQGQTDRRAHYHCAIVLTRGADDPEPLIAEGRWSGEIVDVPRGANGFGYDPYFYLREFGRTAAELTADEKNAISHRGKALARLLELLRDDDAPLEPE